MHGAIKDPPTEELHRSKLPCNPPLGRAHNRRVGGRGDFRPAPSGPTRKGPHPTHPFGPNTAATEVLGTLGCCIVKVT